MKATMPVLLGQIGNKIMPGMMSEPVSITIHLDATELSASFHTNVESVFILDTHSLNAEKVPQTVPD